jgi:hypothetical protein
LSTSDEKENAPPFLAADELVLVADGVAGGAAEGVVAVVTDVLEPMFTSPLRFAAMFACCTSAFAAAEPEPSPIPAQELAPEAAAPLVPNAGLLPMVGGLR